MFGSGKPRSEIMPILVVVEKPNWTALGEPTTRSQYLFHVLESMGGVADTVEDGKYYFNEEVINGQFIRTLYPVPE